ncbi:MAG: YitT family protein [Bacilli bacterium]
MKILNYLKNRQISMVINMLVGTIIYSIAVVFILDLGEFYAGGVTGFSQLLTRVLGGFDIHISKSIFVALFNAPLFIISWKGVSKRFAVLSVISVGLQVILLFVFEKIRMAGFSPFIELADEKLLLAIVGGLLTGVGCGVVLRGGSSSGGLDIISQYVSLNKNISFAKFSLSVDLVIITAGGLVAGNIAVAIFTITRMLVHIITLDKIHTIYRYIRISIVTTEKDKIRPELVSRFHHGVTIYQVVGGFTNQEKWVLEAVVSSYEVAEYRLLASSLDPKCFITTSRIESVFGNFKRKTIT